MKQLTLALIASLILVGCKEKKDPLKDPRVVYEITKLQRGIDHFKNDSDALKQALMYATRDTVQKTVTLKRLPDGYRYETSKSGDTTLIFPSYIYGRWIIEN